MNLNKIEERLKKVESKFSQKDGWDKFEITSTFLGSLMSAVVALGIFSLTHSFNKHQAEDQKIRQEIEIEDRKSNFFIATLSAREKASMAIKKDTFTILIEKFFDSSDAEISEYENINLKIIIFESIARNFKNQFEISPLFRYLEYKINENNILVQDKKIELFNQVKKIARDIALDEMAQISGSGGKICTFNLSEQVNIFESEHCDELPLIIKRIDDKGEENVNQITVKVADTSYLEDDTKEIAYQNSFEVGYLDTPFIDNSAFAGFTYSIILSNPDDPNEIKFVLFPKYFKNSEINRLRIDKMLDQF